MQGNWNSREPIYRQLRDRAAEKILDGVWPEGEAAPSVRTISNELRVNPVTVSRAWQMLVDEQLLEVRRGLGMYVAAGARERLREAERSRFLAREWPAILKRAALLGLKFDELPRTAFGPPGQPAPYGGEAGRQSRAERGGAGQDEAKPSQTKPNQAKPSKADKR